MTGTWWVWLAGVVVIFGGGVWCGWRWSHPLVQYFQVEVMRHRLRIMQRAWETERRMWRDGRPTTAGRRR